MRLNGRTQRSAALAALASAALLIVTGQAVGNGTQMIVVDAVDRGHFAYTGFHDSDNLNFIAGNSISTRENRNFFVFDLSGVQQPIISAQLHLLNPSVAGYLSVDPTELYRLSKVSTSPVELMMQHVSAVDIYNDLASSPEYGDYLASAADNQSTVVIDLTADALLDLNSANGLWAVGGALFTLDNDPQTVEHFFAVSGNTTMAATQLVLTVIPAPGALLPLIAGVCSTARRRR